MRILKGKKRSLYSYAKDMFSYGKDRSMIQKVNIRFALTGKHLECVSQLMRFLKMKFLLRYLNFLQSYDDDCL